MFAKNMAVGYLLDFYGGMLTERARSIMEQYYRDDLSLGEIALNFDISRQGVRHVIKHAEEQLLLFEETLPRPGNEVLTNSHQGELPWYPLKSEQVGSDRESSS